jgi:two-component system chemotaxis response regulator CheY
MRTLIVEDDFTSRLLMQEILNRYGPTHIAANGREAVEAVKVALDKNEFYDLICMDIHMPEMDGQTSLKHIRKLEEDRGIFSTDGAKIVMTTALNDMHNVAQSFNGLCDAYMVKPIDRAKLLAHLRKLGLKDV